MKRGPRITCTCGTCTKCKVREKVRKHRAAVKAKEKELQQRIVTPA